MARQANFKVLWEDEPMRFTEFYREACDHYRRHRHYSERTIQSYGTTYYDFGLYLKRRGLNDDLRHFNAANTYGFMEALRDGWVDGGQVHRGYPAASIKVKLAALSTLAEYGKRRPNDA